MLIDIYLAQKFWAEIVNTVYYVNHMSLIRSLLNNSQTKLCKGFRCKCFVLNNGRNDLGKFDPQSDECVFVGYLSSSVAYIVFSKRALCIEELLHSQMKRVIHELEKLNTLMVPNPVNLVAVLELTRLKMDLLLQVIQTRNSHLDLKVMILRMN